MHRRGTPDIIESFRWFSSGRPPCRPQDAHRPPTAGRGAGRYPACGCSWVVVLLVTAAAAATSAARADDGDALVIVNGQPLSKKRVVEVLLESHGLSVMQQLIALELAREESRRLKLSVSDADIERENERAMERIAPSTGSDGKALTAEERRQSLDGLLREKGLTLVEFRLAMERNAHLRKAVEHGFEITEATLREEFARLHGEKVEVRHIQVGDVNGLHEALNRLDQGHDFAEIARTVSENQESAANGGLLAPFAFNDEAIAPVLREAAFALKPGEVTKPIRVARWWHILKLERRLPAADVTFDAVRTQVEQTLRDRVLPQEMNKRLATLFQKAQIRVLDSKLKDQFDRLMRENAATGAAPAP